MNVLAGTVDVVASMSEAGGLHVGPTKTGKRRTITIPRFLAQMLGEHIGRYPSPDGWVFTAAEGGPVHHHNFRHRHYDAGRSKPRGSPDVRFHDLRHTCAALLIAAGRHLEEVKTYLGHSSIRVTSDRYGHLFPGAHTRRSPTRSTRPIATLPRPAPRPHRGRTVPANANQRPRRTADLHFFESGRRDSNRRPQPWQGCALPAEPRPRRAVSIQGPSCAGQSRSVGLRVRRPPDQGE